MLSDHIFVFFLMIFMYVFWPYLCIFYSHIWSWFLTVSVYAFWSYLRMLFDHIWVCFWTISVNNVWSYLWILFDHIYVYCLLIAIYIDGHTYIFFCHIDVCFLTTSVYVFWQYLCFLGISVYVYWPYLCMLFDHICVRFLRNYSRHYQPRACRYLQHRGSALPSQSAEIILSSFKPTVFNTLGKAHASPSGFPTTRKF